MASGSTLSKDLRESSATEEQKRLVRRMILSMGAEKLAKAATAGAMRGVGAATLAATALDQDARFRELLLAVQRAQEKLGRLPEESEVLQERNSRGVPNDLNTESGDDYEFPQYLDLDEAGGQSFKNDNTGIGSDSEFPNGGKDFGVGSESSGNNVSQQNFSDRDSSVKWGPGEYRTPEQQANLDQMDFVSAQKARAAADRKAGRAADPNEPVWGPGEYRTPKQQADLDRIDAISAQKERERLARKAGNGKAPEFNASPNPVNLQNGLGQATDAAKKAEGATGTAVKGLEKAEPGVAEAQEAIKQAQQVARTFKEQGALSAIKQAYVSGAAIAFQTCIDPAIVAASFGLSLLLAWFLGNYLIFLDLFSSRSSGLGFITKTVIIGVDILFALCLLAQVMFFVLIGCNIGDVGLSKELCGGLKF